MTKKIAIGMKPSNKIAPATVDDWVENRVDLAVDADAIANTEAMSADNTAVSTGEKTKRLTIDISESLHRQIKAQCAQNGSKISDEVRALLLQKYGNQ